ncbi:hypothetical protein ACERII_20625 [Evansella sp. AB-rgal1]|uniref:hypothetical protein n=1 Tax=Evansella sp. AB-rgal1 TaxID=3242696 RepID=UPI00359D45BA
MEKEFEKLILEELRDIKGILGSHTEKLDKHSVILDKHSEILDSHTKKLDKHSEILDSHTKKLDQHSEILGMHGETLREHGRMLSALRTGQEELKAELDGMRLENAKEFGELKENVKNVEASIEVLKDETWMNKKDIYRIKTTMGLK